MANEKIVSEHYRKLNKSSKGPKKFLEFLKKNKNVLIISFFVVLLIVLLLIVFGSKGGSSKKIANKDSGIRAHTEEGIIKEEEFNGIKFSNISMLTEKGYTTVTADVTNVSDNDITNERLHLSLKDKDGNESIKLLVYIPNGLKKGETKTITASAHGEFSEVVSKEVME